MTKSEWGPKLWNFLHACSFAFPENPSPEEKQAFSNLLDALKILVPCPECRFHYCSYMEKEPVPLTCGSSLKDWLIEFHNSVNRRTGKPEITTEQAQALYGFEDTKKKKTSWWSKYKWVIIIAAILFIIISIILLISIAYKKARSGT